MNRLSLSSPFGAPIYHIDETTSTMDEARRLAAAVSVSAPLASRTASMAAQLPASPEGLHGAVVAADYQRAGRGRAAGRVWLAAPGESLLCTIILYYPQLQPMPAALPLRLGVAAALTLEGLWPPLAGRIRIKWPNDVLIDGKKAAGILCEAEGPWIYAGIGINLLQQDFPPELRHRSVSVLQALENTEGKWAKPERWQLLINMLDTLKPLLEDPATPGEKGFSGGVQAGQPWPETWHQKLEARLYKRGEAVRFLAGSADAPYEVQGILEGVAPSGELLIRPSGSSRTEGFITGELDVFSGTG